MSMQRYLLRVSRERLACMRGILPSSLCVIPSLLIESMRDEWRIPTRIGGWTFLTNP